MIEYVVQIKYVEYNLKIGNFGRIFPLRKRVDNVAIFSWKYLRRSLHCYHIKVGIFYVFCSIIMQTIYFCTTNKGKMKKLQNDFSVLTDTIDLKIIDFEIKEIQDMDCETVAKTKVLDVFAKIKKPCLAMDSGFYVEALNNFPGSYTKMALQTIGVEGIIKLLENKSNRNFLLRNCLAYYDGENTKIVSKIL